MSQSICEWCDGAGCDECASGVLTPTMADLSTGGQDTAAVCEWYVLPLDGLPYKPYYHQFGLELTNHRFLPLSIDPANVALLALFLPFEGYIAIFCSHTTPYFIPELACSPMFGFCFFSVPLLRPSSLSLILPVLSFTISRLSRSVYPTTCHIWPINPNTCPFHPLPCLSSPIRQSTRDIYPSLNCYVFFRTSLCDFNAHTTPFVQ